jgi:hypothetical protein
MAKRTRVLSPSVERRHFPRHQIDPEKSFDLVAHLLDGERWLVDVLDLSKVGIGLLFDRRLNPDQVVTLSLQHIPRRFACALPVRVVFVAQYEGVFLLGAAFTRQLTDEEMAGLL